jgi:hypothetical protein
MNVKKTNPTIKPLKNICQMLALCLSSKKASLLCHVRIYPSAHMSACISAARTGRISMKFNSGDFYGNFLRNSGFDQNRGGGRRALYTKTRVSRCCWYRHSYRNNAEKALCSRDNAFNVYYIVDSDIYTSAIQRERIRGFPWQQWLCERAAILCYAYLLTFLFIVVRKYAPYCCCSSSVLQNVSLGMSKKTGSNW